MCMQTGSLYGYCEHGVEHLDPIKCEEFLDCFGDYIFSIQYCRNMGALILYTTPTVRYFTVPMGGRLTVLH